MSETFLKLGDIAGESVDDRHKGEIELVGWSWGVSNGGSVGLGGGAGAGAGAGVGKVRLKDLTFTHRYDKASPALAASCARGAHLKDATITARKAGEGQKDVLIVKLDEVLVTAVDVLAEPGSDELTETVTLAFRTVHVEYRPQSPDGAAATPITFGWDVSRNQAA